MDPGHEPVAPREVLFRRIPRHWYPDAKQPSRPQLDAFLPRRPDPRKPGDEGDADGLSIFRAKYTTVKQASVGANSAKPYHVASLTLETIESISDSEGNQGLSVRPDPLEGAPGHSLIPELNARDYLAGKRQERQLKEWALALAISAHMVLKVE